MNRWSPERTRRRLATRVKDAAVQQVVAAAQQEHAARFRPFRPATGLKILLKCSIVEEMALTVGVSPELIGNARTLGRRKAEAAIPNITLRSKISKNLTP